MRDALSPIVHLSAALFLSGGVALPQAQSFASTDAVRGLTRALEHRGLDAIATADPAEPGTFVAALYIPGGQLLVVSARDPSVDGVAHRIALRQYREVYLNLQGTPTLEGKFFVQDADADGILSALAGTGSVDVLYEDSARRIMFNGEIQAQHLTPAEYDAKLPQPMPAMLVC